MSDRHQHHRKSHVFLRASIQVFSAGGLFPFGGLEIGRLRRSPVLILGGLLLSLTLSYAQQNDEPGRSIGKGSMQGDLIVMELDQGALASLFDLIGHALRFTPEVLYIA